MQKQPLSPRWNLQKNYIRIFMYLCRRIWRRNCATRQTVFPGAEDSNTSCLKLKSRLVKQPPHSNDAWMNNFMTGLIENAKPIWKTYHGFTRASFNAEVQFKPNAFVQGIVTATIWLNEKGSTNGLINHYSSNALSSSDNFIGLPLVCGLNEDTVRSGPKNPCKPNPCKNGGICSSKGKTYKCTCTGGYRGRKCVLAPSPCRPNPCRNGGKCIKKGSSVYICNCERGYGGITCRLPPRAKSSCDGNPCKNGGRCISPDNKKFVCECKPGFSGVTCGKTPNPCIPSPCSNGGRCGRKAGGGFICTCVGGYSGALCIQPPKVTDPCKNRPCRNGAKCISPDKRNYVCQCTAGFAGPRCRQITNPCVLQNCRNGGQCLVKAGRAVCTCIGGYTGPFCRTAPPKSGSCEPINPCQNGGRCRPSGVGFFCDCSPGFSGVSCQQMVHGGQSARFCIELLSRESPRVEGDPNWFKNLNDGLKRDLNSIWVTYPGYLRSGFEVSVKSTPNGMMQATVKSTVWVLLPKVNQGSALANLIQHFDSSSPSKISFTGTAKMCDAESNYCEQRFCGTGRNCAEGYGGFVCVCNRGYSGQNCEIAPVQHNYCRPNPCQNSGVCRSPDDKGYVCDCTPLYTGRNCQTKTTGFCQPNPCANGGKCTPRAGSYICLCVGDYGGSNCDQPIGITGRTGVYCLEIMSADAKGSLSSPNFFENFVEELKKDLRIIWKSYSGFMRSEFGIQARTKPNGKVQATIRVTVYVSLAGRDKGVTVQDLVKHFIQSRARKSNFIGIPQACT